MSKAPEICIYCKGTGNGPCSPCGFCENGIPLDTQEDWDNSWGKVGNWHNEVHEEMGWFDKLLKRKIENGDICGGCGEWPDFCCCEG